MPPTNSARRKATARQRTLRLQASEARTDADHAESLARSAKADYKRARKAYKQAKKAAKAAKKRLKALVRDLKKTPRAKRKRPVKSSPSRAASAGIAGTATTSVRAPAVADSRVASAESPA